MPMPDCFAPADARSGALPLHACRRDELERLVAGLGSVQQHWIWSQNFQAEPNTCLVVPGDDGRPALALAGVADASDPFALAHLPLQLPPGDYRLEAVDGVDAPDPLQSLVGWGLGAYRFDRYLTARRPPARLVLPEHDAADVIAQVDASCLVRDLVNTPTEHMGPDELEAAARELAQTHGGEVEVVSGEDLLAHNFPAIHAVGRASHRAPRLIQLRWGKPGDPHVAIIGKGVCFDTGGLDIKPGAGMRNMKKDMGGAAHALGLAQLVMDRQLPIRITVLVPAVENAIAANSYRPGDVIATRAGLSIEIDNTDAEGRIVLCDALTYAAESDPELVLDFATLTGAARIALGPELPALYSNDEALAADYLKAAADSRDPLWRMPLWQPYLNYLKSPIADWANSGASRMAGSITAALYLQRFVPAGLPWAHSDVFAWSEADRPGHPVGGDAQGLRAAYTLLKARYAGAG
ncbi:leucyl aminopeptidase family protein [Alkalisalibacterium limincola]|uniref:Leucyl aminopeptidase family protein n=1 Tax=Alkalisalibacterium limincola TaxID=2699169 RepID=A0A5C8KKI5_9GAMM|nr:leucyl aminopeptidase family protein [Alkalisalibacterium limincola]TXK59792.1 leucyl aminopeptidase family protein [Alkalisalibacterium limincola]